MDEKIIIFVGILSAIFFIPKFAEADTELPNTIENEVTLTADNSPYIVGEEGLGIINGGKLNIEPGVTILFPQYSSLYGDGGTLNISGTPDNPVVMKGKDLIKLFIQKIKKLHR